MVQELTQEDKFKCFIIASLTEQLQPFPVVLLSKLQITKKLISALYDRLSYVLLFCVLSTVHHSNMYRSNNHNFRHHSCSVQYNMNLCINRVSKNTDNINVHEKINSFNFFNCTFSQPVNLYFVKSVSLSDAVTLIT